MIRHPEARAISAFTRVFDTLWQASKDDRPPKSAVADFGEYDEADLG